MTKNTGGPAFPHESTDMTHPGLTMRDYFAAKVLAPLTAAMAESIDQPLFEKVIAIQCYLIADAMLAEREK